MQRWAARAASAIGALLGLWFGYDVGRQIAGELLGWLMAFNAGLFGALIGGALVERVAALAGMLRRRRNRLH